jgi:hypothetical protein
LARAIPAYKLVRSATTKALPARTLATIRHCVNTDRAAFATTKINSAGPSVG